MPPSIPAVIYAGLAGVSTGALFAASVVPALLMALGLCVVVFLWVRRMPNLERTEFSWDRVWVTGRRVIAPLGAPVIILGGILGGYVHADRGGGRRRGATCRCSASPTAPCGSATCPRCWSRPR